MQPQDNLDFLARRVGEGDFQAKAQLRQELEPGLPLIVRRVLERGTAHSSLERKIDALFCHASQLTETGEWFRQFLRDRAEEAGREAGVAYAEGFRRLSFGG